MSSYVGVYSTSEAMTHRGITVSESKEPGTQQKNLLKAVGKKTRERSYITEKTLEGADINVAKIRMLSALPEVNNKDAIFSKAFVGFILTGVSESYAEKVEIVPLPGDAYASYFFGSQPRQYSFQGILLNTDQDKWRDSFELLYTEYLRGSAASRLSSVVQVSYDNRVVTGWLTSFGQQVNSNSDLYSSFNFTMLVSRSDIIGGNGKTYESYLSNLGDNLKDAQKLVNSDYNVLNQDNLDGTIDKVNTAFVAAPPEPKRGKGKGARASGCAGVNPLTTAGRSTTQSDPIAGDALQTAKKCGATATLAESRRQIKQKEKELQGLTKEQVGSLTQKELSKLDRDIRKARTELANLKDNYNNLVKNPEIEKMVEAEVKSVKGDTEDQSGKLGASGEVGTYNTYRDPFNSELRSVKVALYGVKENPGLQESYKTQQTAIASRNKELDKKRRENNAKNTANNNEKHIK